MKEHEMKDALLIATLKHESLWPDKIFKEQIIPVKDIEEVNNLLIRMSMDGYDAAKIYTGIDSYGIEKNYNTKSFLDNGGYTAIYEKQLKET